jgi:hypothetical protein
MESLVLGKSNLKLRVNFVANNISKRRFRYNVEKTKRGEINSGKMVFMVAIATHDEL